MGPQSTKGQERKQTLRFFPREDAQRMEGPRDSGGEGGGVRGQLPGRRACRRVRVRVRVPVPVPVPVGRVCPWPPLGREKRAIGDHRLLPSTKGVSSPYLTCLG